MNSTLLPAQIAAQATLPAVVSPVMLIQRDDLLRESRRLVLSRIHPLVRVAEDLAGVFTCGPDVFFRLIVIDMSDPRSAERVAFYARRRWPRAKILLLGSSCAQLDDFLYDDIVDPGRNAAAFLEVSRRLYKSAAPDGFETS